MRKFRLLAPLWLALFAAAGAEDIDWRGFDPALLARAREEKKLVFVDVEAVWCHWCHVMDRQTYADATVQAALQKNFLCAKVDQDARPDLARRYQDYGWPALVVLDPVTMKERAIGSGFQPPEKFLALLEKARTGKELEALPTTVKPGEAGLSEDQRRELRRRLTERFDPDAKGWGGSQKFVAWQNIECCIAWSQQHSGPDGKRAAEMARETLDAGRALIDPVWGGVYQYSTDGDWAHPHFEKIMEYQAEICRAYALAYLAWGREEDLQSARRIGSFLRTFLLSPEGAFYTSQDADLVPGQHSADYFALDDAGRRAKGIPRIDRHQYARENGMAIRALVALWRAGGDDADLAAAARAGDWALAHRLRADGGFSHEGGEGNAPPFLADQAPMLAALLELHQATAEGKWLERARATAAFINRTFKRPIEEGAGFLTAAAQPDLPASVADRDENIALARACNFMARLTGDAAFSTEAAHAMRYLSSAAVIEDTYSFTGGLLLADAELASEPAAHLVIVGKRDDAVAKELFVAAQKHPASYRVIEWLEPGAESGGIGYPVLDHAAAYLCSDGRCSLPVSEPQELRQKMMAKAAN